MNKSKDPSAGRNVPIVAAPLRQLEPQYERIERSCKPPTCPRCGHTSLAEILYGLPDFSPELREKLEAGTVSLGGCCITDDDPAWQCNRCRQVIYRKNE